MDFLDDVVVKAKEVFDVASKKTGEALNTQKQRIDILSFENKLSKDYEALGKLYFALTEKGEENNAEMEELVEGIKEKISKIEALRNEINCAKSKLTCKSCGAGYIKGSKFCPACGAEISED